MKTCPACSKPNNPQARFCQQCGQSLLTTASATGPLPVGTMVESYKIIQQLGRGGMGAVYLVKDTQTFNKPYALKEMLDRFTNPQERAEALQLFEEEARTLVRLNHPNLPHVTRYFPYNQRQYLLMEYIEGQTLEELLLKNNGPLPELEVGRLVLQLCNVLTYLHQQTPPIIFRDLKPANIMLKKDGVVKLIDFGIARMFDPNKTTDTLKMGSVGYAPPEQYGGKGQTDPRSDVYALGATMHQLLTGHNPSTMPFVFNHPRQLNPKLSVTMDKIIMKAVDMNPNQRYQSIQALRVKLKRWELTRDFVTNVVIILLGIDVAVVIFACGLCPLLGLRYSIGSFPPEATPTLIMPTADFVIPTPTPIAEAPTPTFTLVAEIPGETPTQPPANQPPVGQPTAFATSTPLPTFTAAAIQALSSPTPRPTTVGGGTAVPLPTVTLPLPIQSISAPQPIAPTAGTVIQEKTGGSFKWRWEGQLEANQGFELLIWYGEEPHYGAYGPNEFQGIVQKPTGNDPIYSANLIIDGADSIQRNGARDYDWSVVVVQLEPYQRIGAEGNPLTFTYARAGGSSDGGGDGGGGGNSGGPNLEN